MDGGLWPPRQALSVSKPALKQPREGWGSVSEYLSWLEERSGADSPAVRQARAWFAAGMPSWQLVSKIEDQFFSRRRVW